ncbi:MAG TPA: lysophospholipid acyltransferase family protein [Pseudonocardiaceae bacterium]|nr:lysophospholipid acyltransferase family protein [Pseudonocardiaceae bacterium]
MLYTVSRAIVGSATNIVCRPTIEGLENVPKTGAVILASNHLSVVDSFLIPVYAGRPVAFLAKSEYFEGRKLRQRAVGRFMGAFGAVPVKRGAGRASIAALDTLTDLLMAGKAIGIHPEGTRSLDGRLHRGHTGVAQLALSTGAPVVPLGLIGTENVLPVGAKMPKPGAKFTMRFGEPLDFTRYDGLADSPAIRRSVTDEIMYAILELSDQVYVDAYHKRPSAA